LNSSFIFGRHSERSEAESRNLVASALGFRNGIPRLSLATTMFRLSSQLR
jgi:hypothetical protein